MKLLTEVVRTSRSIIHLDLSWNSIVPLHMKGLLEILAKNRRLQYLNLSWNSIIDQNSSEKQQDKILNYLSRLIKFNMKLGHVDLTCTGLTKYVIYELGRTFARSRALLAVHLSGNPGLSDDNKTYLNKRIKCRPNEDM